MTDTEKIKMIREAMPTVQNSVYLNVGSVGPLSTITRAALKEGNDIELATGRASMNAFMQAKKNNAALRQAFAQLVKADSQDIALTHHTTDGMNIAIHGFNWQPGDEVITTNLEHPGGLFPPYILRQRYGVVVKVVDIPSAAADDDIVARLETAITPRSRLLVFSHVAWNTGKRLPLEAIVAMGQRHHVLSVVDAAQSVGALPLDLPVSGVDFYAMPAQKWLCGPEGVGALYIRSDRMSMLEPTFVGYRSMGDTGMFDFRGYYMPSPDARRYETGTTYRPAIKAMVANLAWLQDTIGWEWIYARINNLADYARQRLTTLSGLTIITPPGRQAGLLTFNLDGYDPARVMTKLSEDNIVVRFIRNPYALRTATGFYNNEADIDKLVTALEDILSTDPESLPE